MRDPKAAVAELRRAVTQLGFVGAQINGPANGTFLDAPAYRPLLQTAVDLDVPLYLHPGLPTATLAKSTTPASGRQSATRSRPPPGAGTPKQAFTPSGLIAAGIFDQLPNLQIILGHMGEMIPFMLNRADEWLTPAARTENNLQLSVAETFRRNFWVTTSGMFSSPQFLLLHQVLGPDRLLFSIDYPFSPNTQGRAFLDALEINPGDKEKLSHRNAERLLQLPSIGSASPPIQPDQQEPAPKRRPVGTPAFAVPRDSSVIGRKTRNARNASILRAGSTAAEHGRTQSRAITKPGLSAAPP